MIDTKKIRNKHGFTLVEIIVVLVILAILAAVAIPSVLGYVDEAKKAGIIQEAHGIYEAAQIAATKCYATDEDEFKKQSIFKYNYTLPADFPYKKTTTSPRSHTNVYAARPPMNSTRPCRISVCKSSSSR